MRPPYGEQQLQTNGYPYLVTMFQRVNSYLASAHVTPELM